MFGHSYTLNDVPRPTACPSPIERLSNAFVSSWQPRVRRCTAIVTQTWRSIIKQVFQLQLYVTSQPLERDWQLYDSSDHDRYGSLCDWFSPCSSCGVPRYSLIVTISAAILSISVMSMLHTNPFRQRLARHCSIDTPINSLIIIVIMTLSFPQIPIYLICSEYRTQSGMYVSKTLPEIKINTAEDFSALFLQQSWALAGIVYHCSSRQLPLWGWIGSCVLWGAYACLLRTVLPTYMVCMYSGMLILCIYIALFDVSDRFYCL